MTYHEWLESVPVEFKQDALWRMKVYRLALFAGELAWYDVGKLAKDKRTVGLADQLYRAMGSVSENISEGYSRSSGRDQARFYEYALGSGRESRGWYYKGRHVLTEEVAHHRIRLLSEVIRLLLTMIPKERARGRRMVVAEEPTEYEVGPLADLLENVPMA